ncbi:uncharacterized protein [Zea mays]|jgi:hypothetical protein|uniref:Uncharacterized protein n=1 Tax=Zea mays TaxID=4577 RepID=C0PDD1_MAIZE|nr:uncharacterized protein LOC111591187 [Zea mays]ACN32176.1 unknown [Zea mays]|eukprot:XP_023157899.1 uncharacterized protein LOC111591187 [Zea mays]
MSFFPNLIVKPLSVDYSDNTILITQLVTIDVYNTTFTKIRTNVVGMGPMRPGLDLNTICSSEDDDVNSAGGSSTGAWAAPKQPKMESVRRCNKPRSEAGSSLAPGLQGGVATSGPRWRRVARSTRVVGRELALQAQPWCVSAGPRVELQPHRVAEEVRHHPEDGRQLRPRQLRRRCVPSRDCR